ncbi:MAG: class I SAM-dependent methyltransferase [Candidatus Gracilibacteria bacterium]|nr:class I SAM-dependent methyltransferase [Candidatus Gracilibacteria bacterium]
MQEDKFLSELKEYGLKNDIPNISFTNARFLRDLVKIKNAKNILEIGTANGFSTINFAFELKNLGNGTITTIEFSPNSHNDALNNFEKAGVLTLIKPFLGNALDIIPTLNEKYDFVFIDGMKKRSKDFLQLVWDKIEDGGVIIIDDVIKFKEKMLSLYEYIEEKKISYNVIPIDEDDGVMMIIR